MKDLENALSAWSNILGQKNVSTDEGLLNEAATATFATTQRIPAVLYPANTREIQEVVQISNNYGISIYPISCGKSWGLGSRVPVTNNSVIVDLSRLNGIIEFNETLSYLTVEPGVSFRQAAAFLSERNSRHFLSVIGGPPDASIIGNTVERGEGLGPYGERCGLVCGLEVVLPDGTVVTTGFESVKSTRVSKIHRWGVGPFLDGLFSQSNLGIVTKMTVWLKAKPQSFQAFVFTVGQNCDFVELTDELRELQSQGVLSSCSLGLWNNYKFLASQSQYPRDTETGGRVPAEELLSRCKKSWRGVSWFGFGALYSASRQIGKLERKLMRTRLRRHCQKIVFLDRQKARLAGLLHRPLQRLTGIDVNDTLESLYYRSVYLGNPIDTSMRSVYWRKEGSIPKKMDPDKDRCGVIWLCHVVPFEANDILQSSEITEGISIKAGFEPNIAFLNVSERCLHMFAVILYDRDECGADEQAMKCHDEIFFQLNEAGYTSYRLGIHSMPHMLQLPEARISLVRKLKSFLDPNDILAPGRYDCRFD